MNDDASIQKPCLHVETEALLKPIGVPNTQVFVSLNMAIAEIHNNFSGELGFISEEDPLWKVGLINTTVEEQSAEVYSWYKIFWAHCMYSVGMIRVYSL